MSRDRSTMVKAARHTRVPGHGPTRARAPPHSWESYVKGVFTADHGHEQVVVCSDQASGLRAIIAIYSTALGPALGGTRFYPYPTEAAAPAHVVDLSPAGASK